MTIFLPSRRYRQSMPSQIPLDVGQSGYSRKHAFLFVLFDGAVLPAGRTVAIADKAFDGHQQPAAQQSAACAPPGDGKHKSLHGVRGTGAPPTLYKRCQAVLCDLFSQRRVTRPGLLSGAPSDHELLRASTILISWIWSPSRIESTTSMPITTVANPPVIT